MVIDKIYFDMDGVLADFGKGVRDLCGMDLPEQDSKGSKEQDEIMWIRVRDTAHFYDRLELMPGVKDLFDELYSRYGDKCEILSAIPKKERGIIGAGEDKTKWVRRLLSEDIVVNIVYKEDKPDYCNGSACILIDDLPGNIEAWEKLGGTGIRFISAEDCRTKLCALGIL